MVGIHVYKIYIYIQYIIMILKTNPSVHFFHCIRKGTNMSDSHPNQYCSFQREQRHDSDVIKQCESEKHCNNM